MFEYVIVYLLGVATAPIIKHWVMPIVKKWLKEKSKQW
jgi:hypothetical protein